ncbi:MAG: hypothetical protein ACKKL5_01880 [Candidatus Komeilibacteria bacterium]
MQPDKWAEIKNKINSSFEVVENNTEENKEQRETIETVVFKGPAGKIRLAYRTHPRVLDKKTTYSNRIGSDVKVDYILSDTEYAHELTAWQWDEAQEEWVAMDASTWQ